MQRFILSSLGFLSFAVAVSCFEISVSDLGSQSIELSKFKCIQEGRFAHPHNCGGYVECVPKKEGNFKRRFGSCHGAMFSSKDKHCMSSDEGDGCYNRPPRSARALSTDRRFSSICSEVRNGFVCADCKTAVNCVEGVAYTETCGIGNMCAEKKEFGGAVCYPDQPENCTCTNPNEFNIDFYNSQMFFFCDAVEAEPSLYHCAADMVFDLETLQCTNYEGLPECTDTGIFADNSNCERYYACIHSKDGWVQKSFSCLNDTHHNLMFNEDTGHCEDPCSWDTGEFTCQEEGRFYDPLSCQHYYECIQERDGSLRQIHRMCPEGSEWDPNALFNNGHCVKANSVNCTPLKVSKCFIPEGRCTDTSLPGLGPPIDVIDSGLPAFTTDEPQTVTQDATEPSLPEDNAGEIARIRLWNILNRGSRRV